MDHEEKRSVCAAAQRSRAGKLIARAEAEFGPLPARAPADPADAKKGLVARLASAAAGGGTAKRAARKRRGGGAALLAENLLAWDVIVAAFNGGQFEWVSVTAALPMGGAITKPQVAGFRYEAVLKLIEVMVPPERRREVLEKFRWVEPYALRAAGGGDAKGSDT